MGCYITKFYPFIARGAQIKKCIRFFEAPFFRISSPKQKLIIEDCNRTCRKINMIFLIFVSGSVTSWAAKPFFWKDYRLPVDVWLPFDALSGPRVYYPVYVFLVIGVSYAAYSSGAIDPLIAGLACHATGQIRVLKDNLQYLNEYAGEELTRRNYRHDEGNILKSRIIYNKIKECVDHHDAILEFVKFYEKSFSLSVFSQFMGSIFVICVTCLQLSMVDPLTFGFVSLIIYLTTMLSEIFLYCYFGSILIDESNSLTDAIYMGEWYTYDIKARRSLITLMERSKRPMVVTAGKILDLSLVTFTTIIRRSYSLLAVLKNY
ncbi:odorant receptor Or1-like [Zophobas morio]